MLSVHEKLIHIYIAVWDLFTITMFIVKKLLILRYFTLEINFVSLVVETEYATVKKLMNIIHIQNRYHICSLNTIKYRHSKIYGIQCCIHYIDVAGIVWKSTIPAVTQLKLNATSHRAKPVNQHLTHHTIWDVLYIAQVTSKKKVKKNKKH